jgi:hypothetical protein
MRVNFLHKQKAVSGALSRPQFRESLSIEYIRVVRSPEIRRVRGCLDKYFDNPNLFNPQYNVTTKSISINNQLQVRYFDKNEMDLPYASTFDCPHSGGTRIEIQGINFGTHPRVFIDDNECPVIESGGVSEGSREQYIYCTLPPSNQFKAGTVAKETIGYSSVRVESGSLPGLFQSAPYFEYRTATPAPPKPKITNIGARRVDVVWEPPGGVFDLMTTGYKIIWFQPRFRSRVSNITVGNVTTTSIRGLEPKTEYVFAVTAFTEGAATGAAILPTDLYGRRSLLPNALESPVSIFTEVYTTLAFDFDFSFFNANSTLNHTGASKASSNGPTGQYASEGNYGLIIVGSAQV